MTSDGGKGSTQRPTDAEAFAKGWAAIDWGRRVAELIDLTEELGLYPEQQQKEEKK